MLVPLHFNSRGFLFKTFMAKFRKLYASFWEDEQIESFSPEDKYFYLFLLTNPKVTECGIYHITRKTIGHYTGYNLESVDNLMKRFVDYKLIVYSKDTSEILLIDQLLKQEKFGKPMTDCIRSEFNKVNNKELIALALVNTTQSELEEFRKEYI